MKIINKHIYLILALSGLTIASVCIYNQLATREPQPSAKKSLDNIAYFNGSPYDDEMHDAPGFHLITGNEGTDVYIFQLDTQEPAYDVIADFCITPDTEGRVEQIDVTAYAETIKEGDFIVEYQEDNTGTLLIIKNSFFPDTPRTILLKDVSASDLTSAHFRQAPNAATLLVEKVGK